jgi:hypothetical protein
MPFTRLTVLHAITGFIATAVITSPVLLAQADFASAVTATHPIAYYRLDSTSGKSEVGATTYKSVGSVTNDSPGATANSSFASLNGKDAYIVTTQTGGVGTAASIMAWVNLSVLPSKIGRLFYVAGESQVANDLDVQFDTDDQVKFWTAAGGHISYAPPAESLVNQWHLIVATLDTSTQTRALYWDGKQVATDKGSGRAGKTSAFTVGESIVFTGRFFQGGIQDAALWNRALKASEVATIYTAAGAAAATSSAPATVVGGRSTVSATPTTGPFATTAKIEIEDHKGPVHLKREEQIPFLFMGAIETIERECQLTVQHACTLNQLLTGSYGPNARGIDHLKFDPNKTDPNYTYTLAINGMVWEAHANPKRAGLTGFCAMARDVGTVIYTINPNGKSGYTDDELGNRSTEGDTFATQ